MNLKPGKPYNLIFLENYHLRLMRDRSSKYVGNIIHVLFHDFAIQLGHMIGP